MNSKREIPRYIHYCWFGTKPLPKQYRQYINTWKKFFPDYEIVLWNETNFPINDYQYAKEAVAAGKMAFVSDVARIYALEKMGGIYFDTDVEVIRSFEEILEGEKAVLGTESIGKTIGTGFMAFSKNHPICQRMMEYYREHSFLEQESTLSNTIILAGIVNEMYGLRPEAVMQRKHDLVIYPKQYFTAYNGITGRQETTKETCCIHHFAASWFSPTQRLKGKVKRFLQRVGIKKKR